MKNVFKLIGIIAIVAVIGFSMAACGGGDDEGDTDPALNGTWIIGNQVWKFTNGSFITTISGNNVMRGYYTTNNNIITIIVTDIYGGYTLAYGLSPGWYSRNDLKKLGVTDAEIDELFLPIPEPYSIIGNTFIWGDDTYTKDDGGTDPGPGTGTAPTITTASLPNGTVGSTYSQTLRATGNTPITWSIDRGTLPAGLSLAPTTGVISGTPTTAATSTFTVKATNAKGNDTKTLTITIATGSGGGSGSWTPVTNNTFDNEPSNVYIEIRAIVYADGKFVAGGSVNEDLGNNNFKQSAKMAYSSNGINWTAISDPIFNDAYVNGIAYGNGKFVAVRSHGKMAYSSNGINWTAINDTIFDVWIESITYGNDKFVAVAEEGKMAYSTDGITWTAVSNSTFGSRDTIFGIAYGGDKFVAVGTSGKMAYSTNGITWTAVSNSTFKKNDYIYGIGWGNNKFVAGGDDGRIVYSTDGITWTAVSNSTFGIDCISTITYGNNKFVAGSTEGDIAYSTDGINWTAEANSPFKPTWIESITYGNDKFVAVGDYGKMAYLMGN